MILQWVPYTHLEFTKTILLFLLFQLSIHSLAGHQAVLLLLSMTMINDILTCQLWSQLSQQPRLASPTTALCHSHVTLFPLPRPTLGRWARKWRFSEVDENQGNTFLFGFRRVGPCVCCLSCSVTLHVPSFSETSPETAKVSPPGAHSWWSKAIPETEVSGN